MDNLNSGKAKVESMERCCITLLVCSFCIPCYLKQAMNTLSRTELNDQAATEILQQLCREIPSLPVDKTPAENSSRILHRIYELAGAPDPFARDKVESNRQAMELWPELRNLISKGPDCLFTALKVAVAGNIVDLGILQEYDLQDSLQQALQVDFKINDYEHLLGLLRAPARVLIIGDNSGEIAFDRLLVEELKRQGHQVTYVVKAGPVLNDVTQQDAEMVGMPEVAEVITTGSNFLGVIMDRTSAAFRMALEQADCVLAKGQANYESLEGQAAPGDKTFFMLKAKCEIVAKNLKVELGDIVLARNKKIT